MDQLVFPPGATLANTIGAIQIGLPLSAFLFGILTLQVYYYFENHRGDANSLRWLVSPGRHRLGHRASTTDL
jgi:hypothetical protein